MRIALVHLRHAGTGGTERYLNLVATHLAERGHEVVIVCRSHEVAPHPEVRFEVLTSFSIGSGWRHWRFAKAVESHVARGGYDLVFGLGRTWSQDVLRLGGGCHRTFLETAYGVGRSALANALGRARLRHRVALHIEQRALRPGACRRIIANSELVKRDVMSRFGLPAAAIEMIHNGVDLEHFHPRHRLDGGARLRESLGVSQDELVVLYLGTGYARKGLSVLLEAFPTLLRTRADARLVVVGYDSARAAYEKEAARRGIADRTLFLGGRRDPELCYGAADLYVLPTYYDPFANSTLEALATGLPVVTTDANGGAELIDHGAQGSVLPVSGGAEALAAALVDWAEPARLAEGSERARERAEEHSIRSKLERTTALLEDVARERTDA